MSMASQLQVHPDVVGRTLVRGEADFFPAKRTELDRAGAGAARLIGTFRLAPGRTLLTVSLTQEVVQFAPFEEGMRLLALIGTNADASPFDAPRVESLIRQFDIPAICGIDAGVLDGLASLGHDAAAIFAGRIVWARPDAYARVAAMPGVVARRCAEVGPVLALECAAGEGMHVDGREWAAESRDGVLHVTSLMQRITPVNAMDCGLAGRVEKTPCRCGNADPRIFLAE